MGGFGSGGWQRGKSTTSNCRTLDVRRLQRDGLLTPGQSFVWNWTRDGETVASIKIQTDAARVTLEYRHKRGGDWKQLNYPVYLEWTGCNLGGQRPWFLCPAVGCRLRAAMLYMGGAGIFACRHCYRLAYESQRESSSCRAGRRANKVRARLGWAAGILHYGSGKPKGMHWRTFYRLKAEHDEFANAALAGLAERIGSLNGRFAAIKQKF